MAALDAFYGPRLAASAASPLPSGYVPYRACREYFDREASVLPRTATVLSSGVWGVAWRHGPMRFEKFMSDAEPSIDGPGPLRLKIWQRLTRADVPAGWWRVPEDMGIRLTGFVEIDGAETRTGWTSHARRHAARYDKLLRSGARETVMASLDEFLQGYSRADQDAYMKLAYPKVVREKAKAHGARMRFLASRRKGGPIDAGLAVLHVPEARQSVHVAAFIAGAAKEDSAATGLVARWFDDCRAEGVRFLDFGFFWAPGDPRDWKGFSRFKSQFGVRLLRYPRPLMRLAGSFRYRKSAG